MIKGLTVGFTTMLVAMVMLTTVASLERGIVVAATELWPDAWFRATLADAYFAFLTVYVWIAYRERTVWGRCLWLGLVLSLGTIAIAGYVLLQLKRLPPGASLDRLLVRDA